MVSLKEINESNFRTVVGMKLNEEQSMILINDFSL